MANQNFVGSRLWSGHQFPVILDMKWVVDNTNPLGISDLVGPYVSEVYMNTVASIVGDLSDDLEIANIIPDTSDLEIGMTVSGTGIVTGTTITSIIDNKTVGLSQIAPGVAAGVTITTIAPGSPNPLPGYIVVKLQNNYNAYLFTTGSIQSILDEIQVAIASNTLVLGQVYVITSVADSTAADWLTVGVPLGVTPAIGVSFVATQTGAGVGSGQVQIQNVGNVVRFEIIGDSDQSVAPSFYPSQYVRGSWLYYRCLNGSNALVTPPNGIVIELQPWMSNAPSAFGNQQ